MAENMADGIEVWLESGSLDKSAAALASPILAIKPLSQALTPTASAGGSTAMVAALGAIASSPAALELIRSVSKAGEGFRVVFSPTVMAGLGSGGFKLMETATGFKSIAVGPGGKIAEHGNIVSAASGGLAVPAMLTAVAAVAAYAQQAQLEAALASIQAGIDRIEARMDDNDNGVCDAADEFIVSATQALQSGPLPPVLRNELASHRAAIAALYGARRRYVQRFKEKLESQQLAKELADETAGPWVSDVVDMALSGELQKELTLYVRALLCHTKLKAFLAICLVEEGNHDLALRTLDEGSDELRTEFLDLHGRLQRLAEIAPRPSLWDQRPLFGGRANHSHGLISAMVAQYDEHVVPNIPPEHHDEQIELDLTAEQVASIGQPVPRAGRRHSMEGRR